jgi:hypothetical protein
VNYHIAKRIFTNRKIQRLAQFRGATGTFFDNAKPAGPHRARLLAYDAPLLSGPHMINTQNLDGVQLAQSIRNQLKPRVERLIASGRPPRLDVILVGEDPASAGYVRNKA